MSEEWRPVVGYEGVYEVSSYGRVKSLRTGAMMGLSSHRLGYKEAHLSKCGIRKTYKVHRLVLFAFIGEPPPGMECCHNNGDRADNRLENLRWDTKVANRRDSVLHGNRVLPTHCKHGHLYDEPNTHVFQRVNGHTIRICRTCTRLAARNYRRTRTSA